MKVASNAMIYLGASLTNSAIPFILLPVLTRTLTPAEYGIIAMFGVLVSIFSIFTGLSIHGSISVRYFQMSKRELSEYVGSCIGVLVTSTTIVIIAVMLMDSWLVRIIGIPIQWIFVAVIMAGVQFIMNIRLSLWQVMGKAYHYGGFQISRSLADAGLSLILVLIIGMAWQGRVVGQLVSILGFGVIAFFWLLRDGYILKSKSWKRYAIDALKFGVPLIPHTIGGLLIIATDRIIITNMLGAEQTGIYMVALQISSMIGVLTASFNKAYAPWLMAKLVDSKDYQKRLIVKGTYLYFILIPIIALIFSSIAQWGLPYLVGSKYTAAEDLIFYSSLGFSFSGMYFMVVNYIFIKNKTIILAVITFVMGVVNIPLTFMLVGFYGIKGASIAFLIIHILTFLSVWIYSYKIYPMPWFKAVKNGVD